MSAFNRRRMMLMTLTGLGAALTLGACGESDDEGSGPQDAGTPDMGAPDMGAPDMSAPDIGPPPEVEIPEAWYGARDTLTAWFEGAPAAAISAVGALWLSQRAGSEAILDDLSPLVDEILATETHESAFALFEQRIAEAFDRLSPTSLAGWQLALTEIQLCALAALLVEPA